MKSKKEIYDICCSCGMNEKNFKIHYLVEYNEFLKLKFPISFKFKQKIYHWTMNDLDLKLGVCPVCGNRSKFLDITRGYCVHCSKKCAANSTIVREKTKNTNIKKYGNACSLHGEDINKKVRKTCLEKHGVEYPMQSIKIQNKAKETYISHLGVDHPSKSKEIQDKKILNCRAKHNKDYYFETEEFKEKSRKTKKEKHGDEFYSNREKAWQTCYELYNERNPFSVEEFKEKIKNTCIEKYGVSHPSKLEEFKEKTKHTCINKFGVEHYAKSEQRTINDKERFNKLYKLYKTIDLKIAGGISKIELEFYEYLISKYDKDDIFYNYMSEVYPFHCDFYIKSLDLYIELNIFWTHGGHPYDSNSINDLNKIKNWKSKNNKYYDAAINVWTISDVNKRNIAKQNGLKYIEIFENKIDKVIESFEEQLKKYV